MKKFRFRFTKKAQALILAMLFIPYFSSCKKDPQEDPKSSEKGIFDIKIKVAGQTWSAVDAGGNVFEYLVPLEVNGVEFNQDLLKKVTIEFTISKNATSNPVSGDEVNLFDGDLTITVTAEDESVAQFTVRKRDGTSDKKSFEKFSITLDHEDLEKPEVIQCIIEEATSTVFIPRPKAEDLYLLESVIPDFDLSIGAYANPQSGVPQKFVEIVVTIDEETDEEIVTINLLKVEYEITAHDGSKRKWTVEVRGRSDAEVVAFLLDFYENPQSGYEWRGDVQIEASIDKETQTITYGLPVLPEWFTPAKMTVFPAVIQISEGATVEPNWNVPQDFSKEVKYTVTAEDGITTKEWIVKAPSFYIKEKWGNDFRVYDDAGDQNINSIAIIDNYLAFGRTDMLINKSDGTKAEAKLNVTDVWKANAATEPAVAKGNQTYPFFVANDDAGNLIAGSLSAWKNDFYTLLKWSSPTTAPEVLMQFPTREGDVQLSHHGRKLQVLGNINTGKGLIIAPNQVDAASGNEAAKNQAEHFIWRIDNGTVDLEPTKVQTNIRWDNSNYGYQLLTPLGLDAVNPYYVGTHASSQSEVEEFKWPNLYFGDIDEMDAIRGPFNAQGYGDAYYLYHRMFTFDGKNMIATFTGAWSNYHFTVIERTADNKHIVHVAHRIPFVSTVTPNGNGTGGLALEKVGDDIFFYVIPTNEGIYCYQLIKF